MLLSKASMTEVTNIRCGVPARIPPILQAVGGDNSAHKGEKSVKGLHCARALLKWQKWLKCRKK